MRFLAMVVIKSIKLLLIIYTKDIGCSLIDYCENAIFFIHISPKS